MSFSDKVVLVTGASSGIGAATAVLFAKEGASVAIVGRNEEKLAKVAEECDSVGKRPLVIKADVSRDDEVKTIVEDTINEFEKLDVLVNNAGFLRTGSILDGNILQAYDEIMATNVRAVINITSLAAPHLIQTKGNIVNVSSMFYMARPSPVCAAYTLSKAALDNFTRCAAAELAPSGVRVNSVNPGPVKTDFIDNSGAQALLSWDGVTAMTALGRLSAPEEIAELIMFLASDKAKGITGSLFVSDNGALVKV